MGKNLRIIRLIQGRTLEDLEAVTGIAASTISRIETGKIKRTNWGHLDALIDALGAPKEQVMGKVPIPIYSEREKVIGKIRAMAETRRAQEPLVAAVLDEYANDLAEDEDFWIRWVRKHSTHQRSAGAPLDSLQVLEDCPGDDLTQWLTT